MSKRSRKRKKKKKQQQIQLSKAAKPLPDTNTDEPKPKGISSLAYWIGGALAAGIIIYVGASTGRISPEKKYIGNPPAAESLEAAVSAEPAKPEPKRQKYIPPSPQTEMPSVKEAIHRYGVVETIINPEGKGNFYLIGMKHVYRLKARDGKSDLVVSSSSDIPRIQADCFFIYYNLGKKRGLNLNFGEGIKPGELRFGGQEERYNTPFSRSWKDMVKFFVQNQREVAYTEMEYSHPDFFVTSGVNDVEQLQENFEIDRRDLHARNQAKLMKELKQPQLVRHYQWERQFAKIQGDMTVAERSGIYLKESQSIADKLGVDDFAFTTGAKHAAQMASVYNGKRRLVLIRPLHLYRPIMSFLHE